MVFYLWLCKSFGVDVFIYVGVYGMLEWFSGKLVVLLNICWLEVLIGYMFFIYLFIVNDSGEVV